jgi:oxygen-independent coproporphyrinogen-3 oxidase
VRGIAVDGDDQLRGAVIARLLCDGVVNVPEQLAGALPQLSVHAARGLVRLHGRQIALTADGWPYARLIAAAFDAHLKAPERHASAV